ncbi:MAG: hypothetical protein MJ135_07530 [Oscillospiraceae bacterium]|nr:hypothetical protein [Oscillospiraceae bacterium]
MKKRMIAFLLCLIMTLSCLPAAFAEPEDAEDIQLTEAAEGAESGSQLPSEGSGTEPEPKDEAGENAPDGEEPAGETENQPEEENTNDSADLGEPEFAEEEEILQPDPAEEITESFVFINPLYRDIVTEDDLQEPFMRRRMAAFSLMALADSNEYDLYAGSVAQCAASLREELRSRIDEIYIYYSTEDESFINEKPVRDALVQQIWNAALEHTGVPDEGDYIRWQYLGMKGYISFKTTDGVTYARIRYVVTYMSDAQQEYETSAAVYALMDELGLDGLSDYEKLRAIYYWICENITYDSAGAAAGKDNTLCHTAYSAIVQHNTVCQGYALLIYRLALECGIDARLIAGYSSGQNHGWNIVRLGNLYYHLDSTWDASREVYAYFLSGSEDFAGHTRFTEYTTAAFQSAYPMAAKRPAHLNRQGTCDSFDYSSQLPGQPSTCSEHGYEGEGICPFCGVTVKERSQLPLADHVPAADEAVAPTTESTGLTEGSHCEVCGKVLQPQKTIPALPETVYPVENTDFASQSVFVGGRSYTADENGVIQLGDTDQTLAVTYSWNSDGGDAHTVYPTGMKLYHLTFSEGKYTAEHLARLDDLLTYCGSSIRLSGNQGIRMITGIPTAMKKQLKAGGVDGYTLQETGTVVAFASQLTDLELTRESAGARSACAYRAGAADPVFGTKGSLTQYTNVLTGFTADQCAEELILRPYAVLQAQDGSFVTVYGGAVSRSIGYVAWQNRDVYPSNSAEYQYVWMLIHAAYGNVYDSKFKG